MVFGHFKGSAYSSTPIWEVYTFKIVYSKYAFALRQILPERKYMQKKCSKTNSEGKNNAKFKKIFLQNLVLKDKWSRETFCSIVKHLTCSKIY